MWERDHCVAPTARCQTSQAIIDRLFALSRLGMVVMHAASAVAMTVGILFVGYLFNFLIYTP